MAILVDLSQVVLGSCYAFKNELHVDRTNADKAEAANLIRHVILSQLKYYNTHYKQQYGKLVVCCDGRHYWRKEIFPYYKANRKKVRAQSDMDWHLIFETMNTMIDDLRQNFMFPVVRVDRAESDDVIATLCKYYQTNETGEDILFDVKQPVLIVSSDKDFVQLHQYDNVHQLSPRTKAMVTDPNPKLYIAQKCMTGDRGDGIPNIMSADDTYVKEQRSNKLTSKKIDALLAEGYDNCQDETIKTRWMRNRRLIDFAFIPGEIQDEIVSTYKLPIEGNKAKIFNYFVKHNCNILLNEINCFVN